MYLLEAVTEGHIPPGVTFLIIKTEALQFHKLNDVFLVLTWTATCAVKLSFMFFFKALITRVRSMEVLWRGVTGAVVITWMGGCAASIVGCPYFDERSCELIAALHQRTATRLIGYSGLRKSRRASEDLGHCGLLGGFRHPDGSGRYTTSHLKG